MLTYKEMNLRNECFALFWFYMLKNKGKYLHKTDRVVSFYATDRALLLLNDQWKRAW